MLMLCNIVQCLVFFGVYVLLFLDYFFSHFHQNCTYNFGETYPGDNELSWLLNDTLLCLSVIPQSLH